LVFSGIAIFFIVCVIVSLTLKGTVDTGDSVMHYLFSRYSFAHPSNFLDHWAKPAFVLLSSPFSQFGFPGIKIFNSLITSLTMVFAYLVAKKFVKENSYLSVIFLAASPLNIVIIFSGLTEPLFAFFLILSLYLFLKGNEKTSLIILSFLPFIRSEGLIIIGVYAVYLLLKRKYKLLPLLFVGHVFYSIAGYFFYHDFLWVFDKIPYARLSSDYGSGPLLHFVNQLPYVIGIPINFLFYLGLIAMVFSFFKRSFREKKTKYTEDLFLVYGSFIAFFIAHSLFWYFGIFNSMGLKRVLIGVIPLISLISLDSFNFILHFIKSKTSYKIMFFILLAYVIIFPFTKNPASIKWKKEFSPSVDEKLIDEMATDIKVKYPDAVYYYYPRYIAIALNIDHFDKKIKRELPELFDGQNIPDNALIIWDNWWAVTANGISLDKIRNDQRFKEVGTYEKEGAKFVLFVKNNQSYKTN